MQKVFFLRWAFNDPSSHFFHNSKYLRFFKPWSIFMVIEGLSFGEKIKKYQKQALTYISSDS